MKRPVTNTKITLIYPYYENPFMFKVHQATWRMYRDDIRRRTKFIVVDDCSQKSPAIKNVHPNNNFDLEIYRLEKDLKWNWEGARNIGAHEAKTRWIFMTDIDHLVPQDTIDWMLNNFKTLSGNKYYTFNRINKDHAQYHPHPNTYFLTKEIFWRAGGYDEEPNILTGGIYGNDGPFRRWLDRASEGGQHLDKVSIIRYTTKEICDAACDFLKRKDERDEDAWKKMLKLAKKKYKENIRAKTLSFKYKKVFPVGPTRIANNNMEVGE